jgi:hypothetical protein
MRGFRSRMRFASQPGVLCPVAYTANNTGTIF